MWPFRRKPKKPSREAHYGEVLKIHEEWRGSGIFRAMTGEIVSVPLECWLRVVSIPWWRRPFVHLRVGELVECERIPVDPQESLIKISAGWCEELGYLGGCRARLISPAMPYYGRGPRIWAG